MILVLFCLWEDASVLGSLKSLPLMFTFATWDQYPVFLHPESPQAAQPWEQLRRLMAPLFTEMASDILCSHRMEE